jgi:hypothetical protein
MIFPVRLQHKNESMNEKGRWLEAIGEIGVHYLVLIRNAEAGVTSHVHAVLKTDYLPWERVAGYQRKTDVEDFF